MTKYLQIGMIMVMLPIFNFLLPPPRYIFGIDEAKHLNFSV